MVQNKSVISSNIASVGYNDDTRDLLVVFHSGKAYIYADVDRGTYDAFMDAPSHGTFLNALIKPRHTVISFPTVNEAVTALSHGTGLTEDLNCVPRGFFNLGDFIKQGVPRFNLFAF